MRQPRSLTCLILVAILVPCLPIVLMADYLLINFAIQTVHVRGSAMYPTIDDNDYLIAEKLPYRLYSPRRGDIIIIRDPYDASKDFIKRVVGLPGERVLVRDCKVYIDQRQFTEPYLIGHGRWINCAPEWPNSGEPRPLGSDEFFVMGDNPDHSVDSRTFGPIKRSQVEAHATLRVLPLDHVGLVV